MGYKSIEGRGYLTLSLHPIIRVPSMGHDPPPFPEILSELYTYIIYEFPGRIPYIISQQYPDIILLSRGYVRAHIVVDLILLLHLLVWFTSGAAGEASVTGGKICLKAMRVVVVVVIIIIVVGVDVSHAILL